MQIKILEVRDRATYIGVFAIKPRASNEAQFRHLRRVGFSGGGDGLVIYGHLNGGRIATADPYEWNDRTNTVAHDYIAKNFDVLQDGDVVDVEYILGETTTRKEPE